MEDTAQMKPAQINGAHQNRKQKEEARLSDFVFGKIMPQAIPLEEGVLGALMLDVEALDKVIDVLRVESFYLEAHQHIYAAMLSLSAKWEPIDLMTVPEEMKRLGTLEKAGGGYYLVELSNRVASAANIEAHARVIAQKYIQRQVITIATQAVRDGYEDTTDVFVYLDEVEGKLFKIRSNQSSAEKNTTQLGSEVLKDVEKASLNQGPIGVPSGLRDLDAKTGGWQKTDLIILAARPGMGKTSAALCFALNAALDYGKPIGIFSLEMGAKQLMARLISIVAEINLEDLRKGNLRDVEWQRLQTTVEKLNSVPIYIDDTAELGLMDMRARARRMKQKYGVEMVIVDYLQLMTNRGDGNKGGNREQEVSAISRGLKAVAKQLDIPVIAISQLSRAVEMRGGSKRPQLSDLRESGGVEQDADVVTFIYRPEYYMITEDEQGRSLKGIAEFIIAKNRNGALDTVMAKFDGIYTRFSDIDWHSSDQNFPTADPVVNIINNSRPTLIDTGGYMPEKEEDDDIPF